MEKYNAEILGVQRHPKRLYFSIDNFYYKRYSMDKHVRSFNKVLIGKKKLEGRYYEFINGEYTKSLKVDKLI